MIEIILLIVFRKQIFRFLAPRAVKVPKLNRLLAWLEHFLVKRRLKKMLGQRPRNLVRIYGGIFDSEHFQQLCRKIETGMFKPQPTDQVPHGGEWVVTVFYVEAQGKRYVYSHRRHHKTQQEESLYFQEIHHHIDEMGREDAPRLAV